jgi:glutamate/tyrosine decarboxylase-like PLP-dependent enzyme
MAKTGPLPVEESLDPEDWESFRALGHRMIDDMLDYLRAVRSRPGWRHAPEEVKAHFDQALPLDPQPPEEIYEEFLKYIAPFHAGNIHPRFWGWVLGTGTVFGAFGEFLAGAMNTNTGGIDYHSANYVEKQVIGWLREILGFPESAGGVLTSGCSAANLIALAVARNAGAAWDVRREGLQGSPDLVLYASAEIHSSIHKAAELLGLGRSAVHLVPIHRDFSIDTDALRESIRRDREDGRRPFCVVGAAGTTASGAVDDLNALADICTEEDLWYHVDGAFGAWAVLAPEARQLVNGMERADSLALDLHKWMYMPYEIGCVLVRTEQAHREAFSLTPSYLAHGEGGRGMTGGDLPWFSDYGFQLSRGFRALKAWMSLKEHGLRKYGRLIQQNIDQARYLARLVEAAPQLELGAPVTLNVVCFRYVTGGFGEEKLERLNKQILVELQERGIAMPSGTELGGRFFLHVANTNHRTRCEDFEVLVREVVSLGKELREGS